MPWVPRYRHPITGKNTRGCPRRAVDPGAAQYVELFGHFRNSAFPKAGGLDDQSTLYRQAMNIIGAEVARIETARVAEHQAEVERQLGKAGASRVRQGRK